MVVVLPTPPFWLHIEITRAWPWLGQRPRLGEDPASGGRSGPSVAAVGRLGRALEGQGVGHGQLISRIGVQGSGCGSRGGISPAALRHPAGNGSSERATCAHPTLLHRLVDTATCGRLARRALGPPSDSDNSGRGNPQAEANLWRACALAPALGAQGRRLACALTCGGRVDGLVRRGARRDGAVARGPGSPGACRSSP